MKQVLKRTVAVGLMLVMVISILAGCGGSSSKEEQAFTMWIYNDDGQGVFYSQYEDNPIIQWLNAQYWDTENKTLGSEGNGTKLSLSFQVPLHGSEAENFNTMISTGDYPEMMDLSSAGTPRSLCEDGVLIEITEWVEGYMPHYLAYLDEHPDLKPLVSSTDEEGKVHYYALYGVNDSIINPWGGYMYRRDWVVKYAEPTEYVWDWESDSVTKNGHPDVTPLAAAVEQGNLNGWKENPVKEFTFSQGDDPNNDWTDNVIFPSGKTDPYTVSDWEWMFEAFKKAIEERGWANDSSAYCTTLYYLGYLETGDLVSSFGGGGCSWHVNENGDAAFGGTGETFKTYLECMNAWYKNGWLDKQFETRASEMFYDINSTGTNRGMVGLTYNMVGLLGDIIRVTCDNEEDKRDAMFWGCSLPINDMYGDVARQYNEPDMLYQQTLLATPMGFTSKCEDRDLSAIFTMFDWFYTYEGGRLISKGLSAEQYASVEFDPDVYAEQGLTNGAYTITQSADGKDKIVMNYDSTGDVGGALKATRLTAYLALNGNGGTDYELDLGQSFVTAHSRAQWSVYTNRAYMLDYNTLFTNEEAAKYSKTNTYVVDYMGQSVPGMIKGGLGTWDGYCSKLLKYDPDSVTAIYQRVIDMG